MRLGFLSQPLFDIEFLIFQDDFTYTCKFLQFFEVFWMCHEGNNIAFFAHTSSTSSAVSVRFHISWDIKVNHAFQAINVDTTS